MIRFDPTNPYPLLAFDSYSYQEAQEHSEMVDAWLGLECDEIEESLRRKETKDFPQQENWQHLPVQALQTPYVEMRGILDLLSLTSQMTVVDLGCAYGRMGFVIQAHHPGVHFIGFELENMRTEECRRVIIKDPLIKICTADLTSEDFTIPEADVYFIFDYGNEAAVKKTLKDLQTVATKRPIRVVARGRLSRFLIHRLHPWLAEIQKPQHFPQFSIYSS